MTTIFTNAVVFLVAFLAMEGVGWLTHRYVMHGPLWFLHRDHHDPTHTHVLQRNDLFFLLFSLPGILLLYLGLREGWSSVLTWAGIGVTAYGLAYFYVHEGVIHRRFRTIPSSKHPYFVALRRAHGAHHGTTGKDGAICFGMLLVPRRYFREALRAGRFAPVESGGASSLHSRESSE